MTDWRTEPAAFHREVAGRFTACVQGVTDWDAPAPVPGWTARSVVEHLVTWCRGFLESRSDLQLPVGPSPAADPVGAWRVHADAVQAILDDDDLAARPFPGPGGEVPLAQAIQTFYSGDVFMHTWDLARASGQDDRLDPGVAEGMLHGMEPIEEMLRQSGHYGTGRGPLPPDPDATDRLMSFIGRDATWSPPPR